MVFHVLLASGAKKLAQSVMSGAARSMLQDSGLQYGTEWVQRGLQNRAQRREALGEIYHQICAVRDAFSAPLTTAVPKTADEKSAANRVFVDLVFRIRHVGGRKFKASCQKLLTFYEEYCALAGAEAQNGKEPSLQLQTLRQEIAKTAQTIVDLIRKSLGL